MTKIIKINRINQEKKSKSTYFDPSRLLAGFPWALQNQIYWERYDVTYKSESLDSANGGLDPETFHPEITIFLDFSKLNRTVSFDGITSTD